MDHHEAAARLTLTHRFTRLSATSRAWLAASIVSVGVLALGVVADLDMWWLSGLIVLGLAGFWSARPVRSRFAWTNRLGAWWVGGGGVLALAAYIVVQFPARASGWPTPNTIGAIAAVFMILALCRVGLQRMATAPRPSSCTSGNR